MPHTRPRAHTNAHARDSCAHLIPGPRFPVGGAGHAVTGPPVLGPLGRAVLAVHGAVGAVVERLKAAHGAELVARTAAGFGAVLPLLGHPAAARG